MRALLTTAILALATPALGQSIPCGGSWSGFMNDVATEARALGLSRSAINAVTGHASQSQSVLRIDRAQGVFKQTFLEFSKRALSSYRLNKWAENYPRYRSVFDRAQREYGVQPEVIGAFWALETDFGAVQGDFNTISAIATLAHDCRRPELFQPQLFAAIELLGHGDISLDTTGAWAGEIGMVQMLPEDILHRGVDGDGDGHVRLKTSAPDAIMSAASMIKSLGWRANEPWLQEVTVPDGFPWERSGFGNGMSVAEFERHGVRAREGALPGGRMQAELLLPQGRFGPKFLAYPNYRVYLEWNQSFVYTLTAGYMATRLGGATRYAEGNPETGLDDAQMKRLQTILQSRGYDVGDIDGILGGGTRAAVQAEQLRMGLPADAWPTPGLLARY